MNSLSTSIVNTVTALSAYTQSTVSSLTALTDTTARTLTSFVNTAVSAVSAASNRMNISAVEIPIFSIRDKDSGTVFTYTSTQNVTAVITSDANTSGFMTSIAQLSTGAITIRAAQDYTAGNVVSYGSVFQTAGRGATVTIMRVDNNTFLLNGVLL